MLCGSVASEIKIGFTTRDLADRIVDDARQFNPHLRLEAVFFSPYAHKSEKLAHSDSSIIHTRIPHMNFVTGAYSNVDSEWFRTTPAQAAHVVRSACASHIMETFPNLVEANPQAKQWALEVAETYQPGFSYFKTPGKCTSRHAFLKCSALHARDEGAAAINAEVAEAEKDAAEKQRAAAERRRIEEEGVAEAIKRTEKLREERARRAQERPEEDSQVSTAGGGGKKARKG